MKVERFREVIGKIVRENPHARSIGLFNWGEPLLHPNLPDLVRIVKQHGLRCGLSANLNIIRNLEDVLRERPDTFRVSLSGFYQETYSRTHKSGDIEVVKSHMRVLRELLDRLRVPTVVEVLYHMYLHNMGEDFDRMKAYCGELRFDFHPVWAYLMPLEKLLAHYDDRLPEKDRELVDLLVIRPEEAREVSMRYRKNECPLRAHQTAINFDGSVSLCCATFDYRYRISPNFLLIDHEALQRAKDTHPGCGPCMRNAAHMSVSYAGLDELNALAEERFRQRGQHFRFRTKCPPIVDVERLAAPQRACSAFLVSAADEAGQGVGGAGQRPKVSILLPTWNRADYLRECLQSLRTVTTDHEIVIVDNGSTDHTADVVAAFAADSRIRYLRNDENIGPVRNFNRAFRAARGAYFCLLGDDDTVLPGNFEKKTALLDAHPEIGLVYSQWHRIDEKGQSQGVVLWPGILTYPYLGTRNEFLDLLPASYIMHQAALFRRELYDRYGAFDEDAAMAAGNDWDLLLRYCYHTKTAFLNEPLVCVRVHTRSHSESVFRRAGKFAEGRIAIWRKWLVEHEDPPVLDESLWQRMRQAFLPDLQYEFGDDREKIEAYLQALEEIKRDNVRKITARFFSSTNFTHDTNRAASSRNLVKWVDDARTPAPHHPTSIIWNAPLFDPSGYADEARHFLLALDAAGYLLSAHPIRWSHRVAVLPAKVEERLLSMTARQPVPGSVHVSHIFPPHFTRRADARLNIGRTMFETDRLPDGWAEACNRMDRVWVPSEFNRETFARAGVDERKIGVVPGAIDMSPYDPSIAPLRIDGARGFNFLSVFDWTLRKGWDSLVRAYVEEFEPDEEVALILQTHSSLGYTIQQIAEAVAGYMQNTLGRDPERAPDIIFQDVNLPAYQMPHLYRAADCFVLPTRGEGWGRPYMEAMAMGLPTIGTNWSGNTAFMTPENSFLLDYELVPVPEAGWREVATFRGHCWAEPDVAHLRRLMRQVFTDRAAARAVGARARADIATRFSYERVAAIIGEEIARCDLRAAA